MKQLNMELWRSISELTVQYNISILETALNNKSEDEMNALIISIMAEYEHIRSILIEYTEQGIYSIMDRDTMLWRLEDAMKLILEIQENLVEQTPQQSILAELVDTQSITVDAVIDYIIFVAAMKELLPTEWVKPMQLSAVNVYIEMAKNARSMN